MCLPTWCGGTGRSALQGPSEICLREEAGTIDCLQHQSHYAGRLGSGLANVSDISLCIEYGGRRYAWNAVRHAGTSGRQCRQQTTTDGELVTWMCGAVDRQSAWHAYHAPSTTHHATRTAYHRRHVPCHIPHTTHHNSYTTHT